MAKIIKKVTLNAPASISTGVDPTKGTVTNPFTQVEMATLQEEGKWNGGITTIILENMKRTFLVLLMLFATLYATAQDFTTEMKEDTTHYNPVCVANDTIYWSRMSKWRAYYLQKRAPVWKLSEKDSKNFDAKTRTFAADPRTTAMQVDIIRYVLQQIGNKKLRALIKENPKAFVLVSLFINKEGSIDNTMITFSCDDTIVGNETIYNLLKNVKSKFNFPHYRELKDSYPYPNGETQVSFPVSSRNIEQYIGG